MELICWGGWSRVGWLGNKWFACSSSAGSSNSPKKILHQLATCLILHDWKPDNVPEICVFVKYLCLGLCWDTKIQRWGIVTGLARVSPLFVVNFLNMEALIKTTQLLKLSTHDVQYLIKLNCGRHQGGLASAITMLYPYTSVSYFPPYFSGRIRDTTPHTYKRVSSTIEHLSVTFPNLNLDS